MNNIGIVVYTKNQESGELQATWCHSDYASGTGIAQGQPGDDYCGEYQVTYFDATGSEMAQLKLSIEKSAERYYVTWYKEGKASAQGIGILTDAGLSVGYKQLD